MPTGRARPCWPNSTSRKQALQTIRREMIYLGEGARVNIEMRAARGTEQLVQRIAHLETILEQRGDL
ncbi:MAG: hypothetical protein IH943_11590 [Acidobacteria bacterium]|nr:hypothetical protein [Acidobacteriota bacterium]